MKNKLRWVIYGLSTASLTMTFIATWLIVRICDNNWADFRLPLILFIVFVVIVAIGAMFTAVPDIKRELDKI